MQSSLLYAGHQQHGSTNPYTVSVDVDLVVMNVHVKDLQRGALTRVGIKRTFRFDEDRRLQEISFFTDQDAPATIGLIVDISNSMAPKWTDVRTAVSSFAHDSNPQDEMFILQFNDDLHWPLPDGRSFTSNVAELEKAMASAVPSGATALYDAIAAALDHSKGGKFEKKMFVIISDGGDNASDQSLDTLLVTLQQANVTLYTVGIYDPDAKDRNPGVLRQLAAITGGEAFFPKNRKDTQDALHRIAEGIRNQYTLGYYPQVPANGRYHKLSVRVQAPSHAALFRSYPAGLFRSHETG